jgi:hypothetical protein
MHTTICIIYIYPAKFQSSHSGHTNHENNKTYFVVQPRHYKDSNRPSSHQKSYYISISKLFVRNERPWTVSIILIFLATYIYFFGCLLINEITHEKKKKKKIVRSHKFLFSMENVCSRNTKYRNEWRKK